MVKIENNNNNNNNNNKLIKLNLLLTVPKGVTPVNKTSATDWQMPVKTGNVISIPLRQV